MAGVVGPPGGVLRRAGASRGVSAGGVRFQKTPGATTRQGLGWLHQKRRAALLRSHINGTLCWWCGLPMYRSQALAADHSRSRANGGKLADRLLHLRCNAERGDGSNDHKRPALKRLDASPGISPSREW